MKWLLSVMNWATVAGDGRGGVLLIRNPLKGLTLPSEENPRRSVLLAEKYEAMLRLAPKVGPQVELALVLAHETGHRIGAIRQLRWSDVDLERGLVRWRGEHDKIGFDHTTPITEVAARSLRRARSGVGEAWVFPAPGDPERPVSRHLVRDWMERLRDGVGLPKGERYGWHSLRRTFASEMKDTPLRDLAHLGGWKSAQTLSACYQMPDEATQRDALARRRSLRVGGLA